MDNQTPATSYYDHRTKRWMWTCNACGKIYKIETRALDCCNDQDGVEYADWEGRLVDNG